jgi:cytochrome c
MVRLIFAVLCSSFLFNGQVNTPPAVKIISPQAGSSVKLNSQLRYVISVADKEDGDSRFQEITPTEVLLQVTYIGDTTKIERKTSQLEPGLQHIVRSNCINCHSFNSLLIGPSFYDIGKKYHSDKATVDLLIKHIREGSTGVWGNAIMPTHPELSADETDKIVQWILHHGAEDNVNYYTGTEGVIKLKAPAVPGPKGGFKLSAHYTDHGAKEDPKKSLSGHDEIIIYAKE